MRKYEDFYKSFLLLLCKYPSKSIIMSFYGPVRGEQWSGGVVAHLCQGRAVVR
jgi:hypothetical protein